MITPGPFAPKVTQWVAGTPTTDAYGNEVPAFTSRVIRVLAVYPGTALEADSAAGDVVTADQVVLVDPAVAVSTLDEFTLPNGKRYKVAGDVGAYSSPFTGSAVTQVNLRRIS